MNTQRLKAIPTLYAGVQMRSKLEAFAAGLFDFVGLEWLYEPQGFDCDGTWYLPDFYLPKVRTFVEIKGVFDEDAERKAVAIARAANGINEAGPDCEGHDFGNGAAVHVVVLEHRHLVFEKQSWAKPLGLFGRYAPAGRDYWANQYMAVFDRTGSFLSDGVPEQLGGYSSYSCGTCCQLVRCNLCSSAFFVFWGGDYSCHACGDRVRRCDHIEEIDFRDLVAERGYL